MRRIVLIFVLSVIPALAVADPAWDEKCADGQCTLSRTVSSEETGRPIATILVALIADTPETVHLGAALPLGAALEPGVRLVQGARVIEAGFEVCFPDGCRAMTSLAADDFDSIAAQTEIELRFFPFGEERPVAVVVPLDGLAEAAASARTQTTIAQ